MNTNRKEKIILKEGVLCDFINNSEEIYQFELKLDLDHISSEIEFEIGFIFVKKRKFSFEETILDFYFMDPILFISRILFTKTIQYFSREGIIMKKLIYTKDVFSRN